MRKLLLAMVAVVLTVAGGLPSAATGQSLGGDSVVGYVEFFAGSNEPPGRIVFDVHSDPSGGNPMGHVGINPVRCVRVSGSTAAVGVEVGDQGAFFFSLVDGPVDRWGYFREPGPVSPTDCETRFVLPTGGVTDLVTDLVITDESPPSTYNECRQAGWVKYGYSSHAQCISSVHDWARQKCIFERVAHGIVAFRAKYGFAPDQNHAMRHCVRLYTGF